MKLSFAFLLTTVLLSLSCTKENTTNNTSIHGLWIGTYTVDAYPHQPALLASFVVYPDGNITTRGKSADGQTHFSSGTWTLSEGKLFAATITTFYPVTAITQQITATLSNGKLINGTWKDTINRYGLMKGRYSTMEKPD